MNPSRTLLLLIVLMYSFMFIYITTSIFVTQKQTGRNDSAIYQPICVVEFNKRYLLLNKDEVIFKISDIPIIGYPLISLNEYLNYRKNLSELSLNKLNYISKIDFEKRILYINIGYKIFYTSWDDVVKFFDIIINKIEKLEPGNYYLLSGGSLISIY